MDKISFQKIESILYKFYENEKKIRCLKLEYLDLIKQKEKIEKDIEETNISVNYKYIAIKYDEKVQSSFDNSSYIEKAIINEISNLERELKYTNRALLKKKVKLREFERNNSVIKSNISMLSEEDKKFVELKYFNKKSFEKIGQILNMGKTTAYRKRKNIIYNIGLMINVIK